MPPMKKSNNLKLQTSSTSFLFSLQNVQSVCQRPISAASPSSCMNQLAQEPLLLPPSNTATGKPTSEDCCERLHRAEHRTWQIIRAHWLVIVLMTNNNIWEGLIADSYVTMFYWMKEGKMGTLRWEDDLSCLPDYENIYQIEAFHIKIW